MKNFDKQHLINLIINKMSKKSNGNTYHNDNNNAIDMKNSKINDKNKIK